MTSKIPQNTQNYLTVMLENKIQANHGESLFANIEGYRQKYIQEVTTAPTPPKTDAEKAQEKKKQLEASLAGGFGSGEPTPKSYSKGKGVKSPTEIMFGDMSAGDIATAGGMYAGGALAGWLSGMGAAKTIDKMNQKSFEGLLGKAAESAGLSKATVLTNIGGQIEDLTGKSWVDAQLSNISRGQLGLVAQGAGSPWVPFAMPGKKQTALPKYQRTTKDDRDRAWLQQAVQDTKLMQQAQRLGINRIPVGVRIP